MIDSQIRPPLAVGAYSKNIPGGSTATVLQAPRQGYSGITLLCRSSHDVLLHVESGVEFDGVTQWMADRSYRVDGGTGDGKGKQIPVAFSSDSIRVRAENLSASATTSFQCAGYLVQIASDFGGFQKPTTVLWDAHVLEASEPMSYSAVLDLSNSLGGQITVEVANGEYGPVASPVVFIQASSDGITFVDLDWVFAYGTTYKHVGYKSALPTTALAVSGRSISLNHTVKYARVRAGGNTGNDVTISAHGNASQY